MPHPLKLLFCFFFILFVLRSSTTAQTTYCTDTFTKNIAFSNFLVQKKWWQENALLLQELSTCPNLSTNQYDTLRYLSGVNALRLQKWTLADSLLSTVTYATTPTLLSYSYLQQGKYQLVETISTPLDTLHVAASLVLRRDTYRYNNFLKEHPSFTLFEPEAKAMYAFKPRKKWVAALLSTIVPGLGKVYVGDWRQGGYAFLGNTVLAVQAYEGYRKRGYADARFIGFGGLFMTFYIGNIWGSALRVHIREEEFKENQRRSILEKISLPAY